MIWFRRGRYKFKSSVFITFKFQILIGLLSLDFKISSKHWIYNGGVHNAFRPRYVSLDSSACIRKTGCNLLEREIR